MICDNLFYDSIEIQQHLRQHLPSSYAHRRCCPYHLYQCFYQDGALFININGKEQLVGTPMQTLPLGSFTIIIGGLMIITIIWLRAMMNRKMN